MPYSQLTREELILRDHLALDRTTLANERTLLSYLRLAIMVLISAVSLIKVYPTNPEMIMLGYALIPFGLGSGALGFVRFRQMHRRISSVHGVPAPGEPPRQA